MPTFKELKDRTTVLVDDDTIDTLIGSFINQGVYEIAGGMNSTLLNIITPPLPELFTIGTVTTSISAPYVSMPTTYHRNLQLVVSSRNIEIEIANSFIEFSQTYPALNKAGIISEVIEQGRKLYYQGIPLVAETLTMHFYRKPVAMSLDADKPDGIPEHLQMSLLSNFASWKVYELLEDGVEGTTPNTVKFRTFFTEALRILELTIPNDSRGLILK